MRRWPTFGIVRNYHARRPYAPTPKPVKPLRRLEKPLYALQRTVQSAGVPETHDLYPDHWPTPSGLRQAEAKAYNQALASIESGLSLTETQPALAWTQIFESGYMPIRNLDQLHRLDLTTLVNIYRASIAMIDLTRLPSNWPTFRSFLLDLAERKTSYRNKQDTSMHGTRITEWAHTELQANNPELVIDFWSHLSPLKKPYPLPSQFFALLTLAHARLDNPNLSSYLTSITQSAKLKSREHFHAHILESDLSLFRSLNSRENEWLKAAELGMIWASERGGEQGMINRAKRWADRRDGPRLVRVLQAILRGSEEGEGKWLQVDWRDENMDLVMAEAVEESGEDEVVELNAKFTPALVASFLLSLIRLGLSEEVANVWSVLKARSLEPTEGLWATLMAGYAVRKDAASAKEVLQAMADSEVFISPNVRAYYVRALFRSAQVGQGLQEIETLLASQEVLPSIVCNRLISDLLHRNLVDHAYTLMRSMPKNGEGQVTTTTINTLLAHHAAADSLNIKALSHALQLFAERDLQPDTTTFNILIQGFIRGNEREAAEKLLRVMERLNVLPDEHTYAPLLNDLVSRQQLSEAEALLRRMEETGKPNEFVYTSLIKGFCDLPLDGQKFNQAGLPGNLHQVHQLVKRVKNRGVPLGSAAYNALISSHFALSNKVGVQWAMHWYRESLVTFAARGKLVFPDTWYMMLDNLHTLGYYREAKEVLRAMEEQGFEERGSLARLVDKIRKQIR